MELGSEQVVEGNNAREVSPVVCNRADCLLVLRLGVVAVYEVQVFTSREPVKDWVATRDPYLVPADVWHLMAGAT
jgi:hypothetical protein